MGSKYQTTNLVFPNFSSNFSQFEQFKKKTLEKVLDSEFVVWWFDSMSSLYHGGTPEYWVEKAALEISAFPAKLQSS